MTRVLDPVSLLVLQCVMPVQTYDVFCFMASVGMCCSQEALLNSSTYGAACLLHFTVIFLQLLYKVTALKPT